MIYSNYDFLILLPLLLAWFYGMRSERGQLLVLLAASIIFLGWTTAWNLLPAALVLAAAFLFMRIDARLRLSVHWLGGLVALLVAHLAYFRYRHFLGKSIGVDLPAPRLIAWLVPLGISFYTFEAISAAVDLHRRRQTVRPLSWSLFIMFLPHLIAGPIVRYRQLAPQFEGRKTASLRNIGIGLHFFTIGFCKKLGADPLGQLIDPFWAAPSQASGLSLILALIGFYCQIYLDFSGYTDMGRGIARMLGFRLPLNFRAPLFSVTPSEFYQRWHVSLSSWIRTFVYDTLAVAVLRRVRSRKLQNYALLAVVLFVMALFGLWHGSAWHYVLFGVAQGFVIIAWAGFNRGKPPRTLSGKIASGSDPPDHLARFTRLVPRGNPISNRFLLRRAHTVRRLVQPKSLLVPCGIRGRARHPNCGISCSLPSRRAYADLRTQREMGRCVIGLIFFLALP